VDVAKLIINAQKIIVEGTIDGNYAGNVGGTGGLGGNIVSSLTGDQTAINTCSNKDNTGIIVVESGKFGSNGFWNWCRITRTKRTKWLRT
jgi:hypothetical protein